MIKRGTAMQVNISGEAITDNRVFTNEKKLYFYLKVIGKKYKALKINIKPINLN